MILTLNNYKSQAVILSVSFWIVGSEVIDSKFFYTDYQKNIFSRVRFSKEGTPMLIFPSKHMV